jgi:predicted Rossmann fold nucleotide-binding protein DprA/Smf involved in DNA uptake
MPNLTEEQRCIYEHVGSDWRTVDDIIEASGLPSGKTTATLALLKLMRLIEQGPGQTYKKR